MLRPDPSQIACQRREIQVTRPPSPWPPGEYVESQRGTLQSCARFARIANIAAMMGRLTPLRRVASIGPRRGRSAPWGHGSDTHIVATRGKPGNFPKCSSERARLAKAQTQPDIGHRQYVPLKKGLGPLDPAIRVVAMRRRPEGLLERAAEMVRAQAHQARQSCEWDVLRQMLFDVRGCEPLLPRRQPSPGRSLCAGVQPHKLVHKHRAHGFEVGQALSIRALYQVPQLVQRGPQGGVLEEQLWLERARTAQHGFGPKLRRIEVDDEQTCRGAHLMPLEIIAAGR